VKLLSFWGERTKGVGVLSPDGELVCGLSAAAEARVDPNVPTFTRPGPLLRQGPAGFERAHELADWAFKERPEGVVEPLADVRLGPPVPRPASIRDTMSFERHIIQATRRGGLGRLGKLDALIERRVGTRRSIAGRLNRAFYERPLYYKSNPHSVVGPDADVRMPAYTKHFDYELEWGIFIGVGGKDISESAAGDHIAGYTIFNDFSARDIQVAEMRGRLGPAKGKDFDTGNAIGPWLVTPDELPEPYALTMTARVNGAEWSRGSTGEMHWRFEEIVSYISRSETLYPGDFIGSGTVGGGCGLELGAYLRPGDVVELEVEGIGVLRNRVVGADQLDGRRRPPGSLGGSSG
jgi:2-keto-4-pentenoate hydratase/2-oxohepta-3-ene-1,7-dioic acid hydratase in catechol pathway